MKIKSVPNKESSDKEVFIVTEPQTVTNFVCVLRNGIGGSPKPEAFAGQTDFLLRQNDMRKGKSRKRKALFWILISAAAVITALALLCFFCPPMLKNALPAGVYYKLSGMKLLRQAAFKEAENDFFYTGRVILEGEVEGTYSVSLKKSGGRVFLSLTDNEAELFSLITDEKTKAAYFRIPSIREEYAFLPAENFPVIEERELDEKEKISFLTGYRARLINSPSDISYETAGDKKWLRAVYIKPWRMLSHEDEVSPWVMPPEAKDFLKMIFISGECVIMTSSEPLAIKISNGSQSVTLVDFEREDDTSEIKLPSAGIDISRGWEGYFDGLYNKPMEVLDNITGIPKEDAEEEEWQKEAVQVNLGMTKIAVKRKNFGLPWSYENLPDGLPELEEENLLPYETLEFMSPDGSVSGVIKNYSDVMKEATECDVILLEISGTKWNMTINKAGIGTSENELLELMGEASWTEEQDGEKLYRYWDRERLIIIDFYVKNHAVSGIRYEITE